MTITNLVDVKEKENIAIVNMEEKTTVTTIIDSKIYEISKLEEGTDTILNNINEKENFYAKQIYTYFWEIKVLEFRG